MTMILPQTGFSYCAKIVVPANLVGDARSNVLGSSFSGELEEA